jgi:hypothetical protein
VLVESSSNFVALINNDGGKILGVVTLHDLLCAKLNQRRIHPITERFLWQNKFSLSKENQNHLSTGDFWGHTYAR